ncbi:hypothetical protein B296_00048372 [Ensete ventricosum]|uniref:Uncharacterized protein n=1 Tax=Ensete ventricosum TaxID=4639 RepID=A0A426YFL2_ENSVE|nr:hypothetical protein B296_00048372 [Ensete ventricosum]
MRCSGNKKINRSAYGWNQRTTNWLSDGSSIWLRRLIDRSPCSCNWTARLTSDWLLCRYVYVAYTGDIMDAGPSPLFVHRVQPNEVLLGMACDLCRCSRYYKIPRNASPITFTIFIKSKKEQSAEDPTVDIVFHFPYHRY